MPPQQQNAGDGVPTPRPSADTEGQQLPRWSFAVPFYYGMVSRPLQPVPEGGPQPPPQQPGATHEWAAWLRSAPGTDISIFVEEVVFTLHRSYDGPAAAPTGGCRRVCRIAPFECYDTAYATFVVRVALRLRGEWVAADGDQAQRGGSDGALPLEFEPWHAARWGLPGGAGDDQCYTGPFGDATAVSTEYVGELVLTRCGDSQGEALRQQLRGAMAGPPPPPDAQLPKGPAHWSIWPDVERVRPAWMLDQGALERMQAARRQLRGRVAGSLRGSCQAAWEAADAEAARGWEKLLRDGAPPVPVAAEGGSEAEESAYGPPEAAPAADPVPSGAEPLERTAAPAPGSLPSGAAASAGTPRKKGAKVRRADRKRRRSPGYCAAEPRPVRRAAQVALRRVEEELRDGPSGALSSCSSDARDPVLYGGSARCDAATGSSVPSSGPGMDEDEEERLLAQLQREDPGCGGAVPCPLSREAFPATAPAPAPAVEPSSAIGGARQQWAARLESDPALRTELREHRGSAAALLPRAEFLRRAQHLEQDRLHAAQRAAPPSGSYRSAAAACQDG
eukprot:TRINITY_DN8993_c0_g1_i2.p1 TRINITY_DN8993_c0_g1~~TRINITY_DN8993_c0_g1_i2.p1  ORF type:complete len:563 (+),score=105.61 TRINITY_DN8993_c0_g1_i2:123-1811(+)